MKRFWCAFILSFGLFASANIASYFLFSTPTHQMAGFPWTFWRKSTLYTSFRDFHFVVDLTLALYFSYRLGRWYQRRGTPDYVTGTKV